MYCDTLEEQTSCKLNMWLLHKVSTTFHTCKVFIELVYDDFIICMIQGESPRDYNLLSSILHSFLFMSFSLRVSHIKFLMRQYQYKNIYFVSLIFFPTGVFKEDTHICSLNLMGLWLSNDHICHIIFSLIFPTRFWRNFNGTYTYIFSHVFSTGLLEELII